MSNELRKTRALIAKGEGEYAVIANNEGLQEIRAQIQVLKAEMNEAKRKAMAEAAAPYLTAIQDLEDMYALYLKLAAG